MRRASGWSHRLMSHVKVSDMSYFVTLTISPEHLTKENGFITPKNYATLNKVAFQQFMKRLRFAVAGRGKSNIKYYACGEYGTQSFRPHYHFICFGVPLHHLIGERDARFVSLHSLQLDGRVPYVCNHWLFGHITVGHVSAASVGYALKYISKARRIPLHHNDDRLKEFALMSKGLGLPYLTPAIRRWHHADLENRMYVPLEDGKKVSMPRYYKDKLYNDEQREQIHLAYLNKLDEKEPVTDKSRADNLRISNVKLAAAHGRGTTI